MRSALLFDSPLARALVDCVAFLAVEIGLLVVVARVLESFCIRAKEKRYVWRVAVVFGVMVFGIEVGGGGQWSVAKSVESVATNAEVEGQSEVRHKRNSFAVNSNAADVDRVMMPLSDPQPVSLAGNIAKGIGIAWLSGSVFFGIGILAIQLLLWRVRRSLMPVCSPGFDDQVNRTRKLFGFRKPIRYGKRAGAFSPYVFGIVRPTLVWPAVEPDDFHDGHREAVLVHEFAHLVGHDPFWQFVNDVLVALLWWHPAVWYLRSRLRKAAEQTADEATDLLINGPLYLAESLLGYLKSPIRIRWCAGLAADSRSRSWMGQRIVHLVNGIPKSNASRWSNRRQFWIRTGLPAITIVTAMIGTAGARSNTIREGQRMGSFQFWKGSVLGLALFAASDQLAPAQSRVAAPAGTTNSVSAAGKSENNAATAIGLSRPQLKQFLEAIETRKKKSAEFREIEDRAKQRDAGFEINKWWRATLQEVLSEEQYSRYLEYWSTNSVVIAFDPDDKSKYQVSVAPHPLDVNEKLQQSLKLTDRQTQKIEALRVKLSKSMKSAQVLVKTPEGLPEVAAMVAKQQLERNEALKEILTEAQYTGYRKSMNELSNAKSEASATVRMAAPVKP